jgi:hypothetical protein
LQKLQQRLQRLHAVVCKREVANALWAVASDVYAFLVGSACDKVWMAAAESDFGVVDEFEMVYWIT